jgi:hypothetical protein
MWFSKNLITYVRLLPVVAFARQGDPRRTPWHAAYHLPSMASARQGVSSVANSGGPPTVLDLGPLRDPNFSSPQRSLIWERLVRRDTLSLSGNEQYIS